MSKTCYTCKELKPTYAFSRNKSTKDGLQGRCKECVSKHYDTHKKDILKAQKEYRINNKEKIADASKKYRLNNKEKITNRVREYRLNNKDSLAEKERWQIIFNKYLLTKSDYEDILLTQNGVCAICSNEETKKRNGKVLPLAVDHCHETGKIRGLLCFRCNSSLGRFNDDPELLRRAAEYVENYPTNYGNVG